MAFAAVHTACAPAPIDWQDPRMAGPDAVADAGTPGGVIASGSLAPAVSFPDACTGSVRFAANPLDGSEVHAVWWKLRADGSAALLAARSDDGGLTFARPVPVDTVDLLRSGCARPAPAVTVDGPTGYIHVVYFMLAPEGPGVFFSHSMEGGVLYHEPVPIVYGSRPAEVAIAAMGRTVVVAYEDPNSTGPRIALAISGTEGHIFEHRMLAVSPSHAAARAPLVTLEADGAIAVSWTERTGKGSVSGAAIPVVRVGQLRSLAAR